MYIVKKDGLGSVETNLRVIIINSGKKKRKYRIIYRVPGVCVCVGLLYLYYSATSHGFLFPTRGNAVRHARVYEIFMYK